MEPPKLLPLTKAACGFTDLRLVIFASSPIEGHAQLFQDFFERQPDSESKNNVDGRNVLSATVNGATLSASFIAQRGDFFISSGQQLTKPRFVPSSTAQKPIDDFTVAAESKELLNDFKTSATAVVAKIPHIQRISVVQQFLWSASSTRDALEKLKPMLTAVPLDIDGIADFFYRVNRIRVIPETEIQVNRVGDWSVVKMLFANVQAGMPKPLMKILTAASVKTDINTVPDEKDSLNSADTCQKVVSAMFDYSSEVREKGDV